MAGEQRLPRRVTVLLAGVSLLVLFRTLAFAPTADQYVAIVERYAGGDTSALARLHHGWVRYQLDDSRAAQDLDAALRDATDDGTRYLAHLFLGAVAERRKDLETAHRQFEAANRLGPFQTATVALGWVEAELGHGDRARAITEEYAAYRDATTDDPWWSYRIGGFAPGDVTWLRQEARRP